MKRWLHGTARQPAIIVHMMRIILGSFFILSSVGKMMNAAGFGELISSYGLEWFSILAPVIIVAEMIVGACLVFRLAPSVNAFASIVMLLVFTAAYAYANIVNGVVDCGCDGEMGMKMPVWATYLRYVFLLLLAVAVFAYERRCTHKKDRNLSRLKIALVAVMVLAGTFWSGNTWAPSTFYMNKMSRPHKLIGLEVNKTPLGEYVHVDPSSTYVVWVFSYTCNGCINSIENVKQYRTGVADHFVALTVTPDKSGRARKLVDIDFTPIEIGDGLAGFVRYLPTLIYIEDGKIKYVIEQTVPNVYTFKSLYLEMSNDEILLTKQTNEL